VSKFKIATSSNQSEDGAGFLPPTPSSRVRPSFAFRPATLPEYLEGRTPKEKYPFLFQKKFHPRQIRNARSVFPFGVAGVLASAWGFLRAYDFGQSHHALCACLIRGSAGNESELFGIMTTILMQIKFGGVCFGNKFGQMLK